MVDTWAFKGFLVPYFGVYVDIVMLLEPFVSLIPNRVQVQPAKRKPQSVSPPAGSAAVNPSENVEFCHSSPIP